MRVGYLGDFHHSGLSIYDIGRICRENGLDTVIFCGGISDRYKKSLEIINRLGWELENERITFRFVISTSDLYYEEFERDLDRERKVRKLIELFDSNRFSLKEHPILKGKTYLFSAQSHYDYTYYRGRPAELSKITRKQKWWYRNPDVRYITAKEDYTLGIKKVFDVRYTRELNGELADRLSTAKRLYGNAFRMVACTNIVPHKELLPEGFLNKYRGTFLGNTGFHEILEGHGVLECHFGKNAGKGYAKIGNVSYYGCSSKEHKGVVEVVEYD